MAMLTNREAVEVLKAILEETTSSVIRLAINMGISAIKKNATSYTKHNDSERINKPFDVPECMIVDNPWDDK